MLLASYQIPFLTIFILIFIAVLTYRFKKTNNDQAEIERRFWEREREANATRRKDISNLEYINIPQDLFPLNIGSDIENTLVSICNRQMLNLTGKANTDLKLEYGLQNLEHLSECDDNFSEFVRVIPLYTDELVAAGDQESALRILEFAVECRADSRQVFAQLSQMYIDMGQHEKIPELINIAEGLDSLSKHIILADLNKLL